MKLFFIVITSFVFCIFALFAYLQEMAWYMVPLMGVLGTICSSALLLVIIGSVFLPYWIIRLILFYTIKLVARFYPKAKVLLQLFEC